MLRGAPGVCLEKSMVQKVHRYRTLDGKEFASHEEAFVHEKGLRLISDVRDVIVDVINTTLDPQSRRVYNIDPSHASALADMLVTTDLRTRLKPLLKDLA